MKRIVLLLLIISLLSNIHMVSFADESIQLIDSKYYEEFQDSKYFEGFTFITDSYDYCVYSLHFFGYVDLPYKPNDNVHRMTFAKGLRNLLALGYEEYRDLGENDEDCPNVFKDIDEYLWEYPIKDIYNYNKEIIKGYQDGSFKPREIMKYEEAVAMMVRALGYEKEMESRRYPIDYFIKAYEIGILDNIEAEVGSPINYGIVSQLFLNSFEVELKSVPSYLENYKTLLQRHCFEILKDITVVSVDIDNQIVECKDNEGTIEVFKYQDRLPFEDLKGKKITFWADLRADGRDVVLKGIGRNKINDYIIRIVREPIDRDSEFLIINSYIDKMYDENGVEIAEPISDIRKINQIKFLSDKNIYDISKSIIVKKNELDIDEKNTLKAKEFARIGMVDNKVVVIDVSSDRKDIN